MRAAKGSPVLFLPFFYNKTANDYDGFLEKKPLFVGRVENYM